MMFVRSSTGIKSFDELKASPRPLTFGSLGSATPTGMVPAMLAARGIPIKIVFGYISTARVLLALEQGCLVHKDLAIFVFDDHASMDHVDLADIRKRKAAFFGECIDHQSEPMARAVPVRQIQPVFCSLQGALCCSFPDRFIQSSGGAH